MQLVEHKIILAVKVIVVIIKQYTIILTENIYFK
jgi:hypothetical protein